MKMISFMMICFIFIASSCEIMPRNTLSDCEQQCKDSKKKKACLEFCNCIHQDGSPLDSCLDNYNKSPEDLHK